MAACDTHPTAPTPVGTRLGRLAGILLDWNAARLTRKALGRLSDHELDDIGLSRGTIERF